MAGEGPYQSDDERYGRLLGNLLNPPPEQTAQAAAPPVQSVQAAALRGNQGAAATAPSPSPAVAPTPPAVTPQGNGPAAPQAPKSPVDYWRAANEGSLQSLARSQKAANDIQDQPSASTVNAPLEARRAALATPIPTKDPTTGKWLTSAQTVNPQTGEAETINPEALYKPGIGTRIMRGIGGVLKAHNIVGALDPGAVGATPYGAPNPAYQAAEAARQGQAGVLEQQEQRNIANEAADTNRLKGIGTEQRAIATGFNDVAKSSTAQQGAEQKAEYNQQVEAIKDRLATTQQQLADLKADPLPKNEVELALKATTESDPKKKALYMQAVRLRAQMAQSEKAPKAGPNEGLRQPMIDAATAKVKELDAYEWNPRAKRGAGAFIDPKNPNTTYSVDEFTAKKNEISTQLDKDLAAKKLQPLGARFNPKETRPGTPAPVAPARTGPTVAPARNQTPPAPTTPAPEGAAGMRQARDGQYYYVDGQGKAMSVVK